MIICYEGTPGSGKSYDAVRKVLDNLKLGRTVYSNIDGLDDPEKREFIKLYTGLDDYDLGTKLICFHARQVYDIYPTVKSGALLVIDEAHKWFNSRNWQKPENTAFADYCSEHRHFGIDILLITQDINKVDAQVRSNIEWTYRYKKINFVGRLISNSYLCHAFQEDGSGKPLKTIRKQYEKRIFQCYKSYVAKEMKEQGIQKNTNILFHPIFYVLPVLLIGFVYLFSQSGFAKGQIIPGASKAVANLKEKKTVEGQDNETASVVPPVVSEAVPVASESPIYTALAVTGSTEVLEVGHRAGGQGNSYVVIGFIADVDTPENGMFYYRPLGTSGVRMRASKLDVDRLCRCNSTARLQAGDIFEF